MNSYLLALKSGFGFLSTIPVGLSMEGIDQLMKKIYFYPVVGAVLGLLVGAVAYLGQTVLPDSITAAVIMVFVYYITGFNHLDGVADLGDGMTAHGSLERKLKALKDTTLGIGGVAFCVLLLLMFFSAIRAIQAEGQGFSSTGSGPGLPEIMFLSMFVAEVSSKQAMLTIATFGKSLHEGLGSMTINGATGFNFSIGFVFGAAVCTFAFGTVGLIAYLAACVSALVLLNRSNTHFGGLNGDGIGMANEVGRVTALITIALILQLSNNGCAGGLIWTLL
ncbi:MAG: adenosylcobinamide-GDP ribazoletransferase [Methanosarcinaceae archaeon]|nr:adenosylcobinamide-GDP ribazoletransferase [Methanosarcinaceae archaeon]MDD4497668.1 adenosylcobinamide-GDP ribazoletransferase [Methanosarcinaceae archaeon]